MLENDFEALILKIDCCTTQVRLLLKVWHLISKHSMQSLYCNLMHLEDVGIHTYMYFYVEALP